MMNYIWIILLGLVFSCQNKDHLINEIAESNVVMCEYVGFGGSQSDQYSRFEKLSSLFSKDELLDLSCHDSLAVATYASFALLDNKMESPSILIKNHLNENHIVSTLYGCVGSEEFVSSLIYDRYRSELIYYPDLDNFQDFILKDTEELRLLDSLILYSSTKDQFLIDKVLSNRVYGKKYQSIIEKWAYVHLNRFAIEYLIDHHKEGNLDKLIESLQIVIKSNELHSFEIDHLNSMLAELIKVLNDGK